MKILLAEDEKELNRAVTMMLRHEHFDVDSAYDGKEALAYAREEKYDVMVFDIMMPQMNGIELVKILRAENIDTPVLFLTAKSQIEDRIEGLDAGADDYLCKPFARGELMARVRALTRRQGNLNSLYKGYGDIVLDQGTSSLKGPLGSERLNNKEYQVMEMLLKNTGRLISTDQMMDKIWGYDSESQVSVVWAHISFLRKHLDSVGSHVTIEAVRGLGYRLEDKESDKKS